MSIIMADVTKITWPKKVIVYKQTLEFTNSAVVYRNDSSTPCPIKVTLYSTNKPTFTDPDTSSIAIYNYLSTILGYTPISNRFYLTVDNPYEFYYNNGTYDCVLASCQVRSSATSGSYFVPWFSVPGATSTQVGSAYTITAGEWQKVGEVFYDFYTKYYLNSASGRYTYLGISKDIVTGEDYISNYCINGVSYPNVTIVSVSGNNYTLSDGHSYAVNTQDMKSFVQLLEVKKIENLNGDVLWEKPYIPTWHTLWSGNQTVRAYGGYQQSGSVTGNNVTLVNEADVLSNSVQVRITFNTYELTYPSAQGTQVTTWLPSPKVSSPWTTTLSANTGYTYLLGGEAKLKDWYSSTVYQDAWIYLEYKLTNNQLSFKTYAAKNTNTTTGGKVNARIVITKIEAYY